MPRFIVPPKYVYSQESGKMKVIVPRYFSYGSTTERDLASRNGMFPYLTGNSTFLDNFLLCAPVPELPTIGNGHDHRSHSRITVTSIRWKLTLELDWPVLANANMINFDTIGESYRNFPTPATAQWPRNPGQFYKFRYMMVQFDEDLAINPAVVLNWFYATYCYYREPTVDPQAQPPTETNYEQLKYGVIPGPISVHSNILRVTTPWIGKFNVLADKCFTITSTRPRVSIDVTIPINRVYQWDDETDDLFTSGTLVRPHIYCFVIPPLSYEQDVGEFERRMFTYVSGNSNPGDFNPSITGYEYLHWNSWMKLNFVDI